MHLSMFKKLLLILFMMFMLIFMLMIKLCNLYWFNGDMFILSYFSINKYSYMLIMMSIWMMTICLYMNNNLMVNMLLMMLTIILMLAFMAMNMLIFFFFFEISLIPIFILIKKWGFYKERITASYYMLMYTLFFSFPMLIMIMYLYKNFFTLEFIIFFNMFNLKLNMFEFLCIIMAFMVKLPIFLFHSWLPKAHVEAPVYGSMYLASLLLKLGSYGIIQFLNFINFNDMNFFMSISMIGSLIISLQCLRIIDMKIIVAYSSIIHMNMMLMSIFTYLKLGFIGAYMMMIAHGLISSSMFYMVNEFYLMTKSRLFKFNKGILNFYPIIQMLWFLICMSNMAIPITLNLISEIFMLSSIIIYSFNFILPIIIIIILNSYYCLFLYIFISNSNMIMKNLYKNINNLKNYFIIFMHWIPINFIFIKLNFFMI